MGMVGIYHPFFPPFPPSPTASTQRVPNTPPGGAGLGVAVDGTRAPPAHCPLCLPSRCSAAGEFFPEAAQVAYRMWELSAVAKVEVSTPWTPSLLPASLGLLLSAVGHGQPHTSALPLALWLLSTLFGLGHEVGGM